MPWQDRTYYRQDRRPPLIGGLTTRSVVWWLLAANFIVFVLDAILGGAQRASWLAPARWGNFNVPQAVHSAQLWRFITYQFIHADFWHLLFNMIALFFFGPMIEGWLGSRRFLAFYVLCGMAGAVVFSLLSLVPGLLPLADYILVGASGAIFGILVGGAMIAPNQRVMLLFPPIPLSLRTMALFFLAFAVFAVVVGSANAGGEASHLGGAALGAVLMKWPVLLQWADPSATLWGSSVRRWWRRRRAQRIQRREQNLTAQVDRILEKVAQHGLHSLTAHEKRVLRRATQHQRRAG